MEHASWKCHYSFKGEAKTLKFKTDRYPYSKALNILIDKYVDTKGEIIEDSGGDGEKYQLKLLEHFGVTHIENPTEDYNYWEKPI